MKRLVFFLALSQSVFAQEYSCKLPNTSFYYSITGPNLTGHLNTGMGTRLANSASLSGNYSTASLSYELTDDWKSGATAKVSGSKVSLVYLGHTYAFENCMEIVQGPVITHPQNCGRAGCF